MPPASAGRKDNAGRASEGFPAAVRSIDGGMDHDGRRADNPDGEAGSGHEAVYQRSFYDRHYAKRKAAVSDQLAHPLFRSFNDRLARRVLDAGLAGTPTAGADEPLRVLEAGCGEGFLGSALQRVALERGVALSYTGSDVSASALELAGQDVPGTFRLGDAADVAAGLPSSSQDLVLAKNLLHHLERPERFLAEAARLVAPGGRVVAVEPRLGSPQALVFNLLAPRRERYFFAGQRRNLSAFRGAGLTVLTAEPFSWLPYELAFVIRAGVFRRLASTDDPLSIARVSRLDDRLTRSLPALSNYVVWITEPAEAAARRSGTNSKYR